VGVKGTIVINPHKFLLRGDVYIGGVKIFHGLISMGNGQFEFEWSQSAGRVGVGVKLKFVTVKAGGKVVRWNISGSGRAWVKLPWPLGKPSVSFGVSIDSSGNFSVTFAIVKVTVNIPKCSVKFSLI
jgi:hypothetical protein